MRNLISIFVFYTFLIGCKKPDSTIANSISGQAIKDSIANMILLKSYSIPDSAILEARHFQEIDSLVSDSSFFYNLQQIIAQSKFYLGDLDSSVYYMNNCANYWSRQKTDFATNTLAKLNCNLGLIYANASNRKEALKYYNEALSLQETSENYKTRIAAYFGKAKVLMEEDEYGEAIETVEKSIAISNKYHDSTLMISALQTYADLYTNCGFFDEANQQFQEVLKYESHFTEQSRFAHHNNKGRMLFLQNKYNAAKKEFLVAYNISENSDAYNHLIAVMNITEILLTEKNTNEAKDYIEALDKYNLTYQQIPAFLFDIYSLKGEYYNQLNNIAVAKSYFLRADSVLNKNEIDNVIQKLHYKRTSKFYVKTGNYKAAFQELEKYNAINKIILQTDNRRQVSTLKYKYQRDTTLMAQKDALRMKEEQLKAYRVHQISLILFSLILIGLTIVSYLYFRKKKQLEIEKNMRRVAALKMESIRGRLSPHLIFNTLNTIWENIDNKEASRKQFDNLTHLIRQSLINTEKTAIPILEEISFVESFVELQKARLNEDFTIEWLVAPNVYNTLVPGMILQIPVENAIKHGLIPKNTDRKLRISIEKNTTFLTITVEDNGVGIKHPRKITKGTGTGLKVLTNTIHLLNLSNQEKMSYEISDGSGDYNGTRVTIKIPVNYNYALK